jgi:hypothetical protein
LSIGSSAPFHSIPSIHPSIKRQIHGEEKRNTYSCIDRDRDLSDSSLR